VVKKNGYTLKVRVAPNRAAIQNMFAVEVTKDGKPVTGADVVLDFDMLDMQMQQQSYKLAETRPGVYVRSAPALVMVGHWGLGFTVTPPGGEPIEALVVDRARDRHRSSPPRPQHCARPAASPTAIPRATT
jgi:copper transport protein